MPTFGAYETVGEPVATRDERGHVSTVWQARKTGARDGRLFVVKFYAPHRQEAREGSSGDALATDRGLEFLEGAKQLKQACQEGGKCLAPIHDFGSAEEGVWYATDFYRRGSLKAWIARKGGVDSSTLRHVIYSVAVGCLALKRLCGRSHGNLQASNVFMVGKPRSLRRTPLALADPYPASGAQILRLDAADRRTLGDLFEEVVEAHDLHDIGELIFQLVEGRLVLSKFDYDYPIKPSSAWNNLGKDGERWRQLCNQLLDHRLSLAEVNLESLAKRFRPNPVMERLPMILAMLGVICMIGGGLYVGNQVSEHRRKQHEEARQVARENFDRSITDGNNHLDVTNYAEAVVEFQKAVRLADEVNDPDRKKTAEEGWRYASGLAQAKAAGAVEDEIKALEEALKIKRDPKVEAWLTDAKQRKAQSDSQRTLAQKRSELTKAITDGDRLLVQTNYAQAAVEFQKAVKLADEVNDPGRKKTGEESQRYASDLAQAKAAGTVEDEIKALEEALKIKRDPKMEAWLTDAKQRKAQSDSQRTLAQKRSELTKAITDGDRLLVQTNYAQAAVEFQKAVKLADEVNDPGRKKTGEESQRYASALAQAKAAGAVEDEIKALEEALKIKRDPKVEAWLTDARQRKAQSDSQRTLAQKRSELTKAIADGDRLLVQTNYAQATVEFQKAVKLADELNDPDKKKTAEEGRRYANALAPAKAAGTVEDEIKALEEALKIKRDPKVEAWLADARQRKAQSDSQRTLAQKRSELTKAMTDGDRLVVQTDYAQAGVEFQKAVKLADEVNDPARKKTAEESQRYASDLAQAKAAGAVEDEIKALEEALKIKRDSKVEAWLADARQRKAQSDSQRTLAQKRGELTRAITDGERLLVQTNYAQAAVEFQKAVKLADEVNDPGGRKTADEGQRYASPLAQAKAARAVEDEINALEEALMVKRDKGVEAWLEEAKDFLSATKAFAAGKYDEALKFSKPTNGTDRFKQMWQRITEETNRLNTVTDALREGRYEDILQVELPAKPPFVKVKQQADEENKVLQEVRQKLAAGVYSVIVMMEKKDYRTKRPFAELLTEGRQEQTQLNALLDLQSATNRQGVLDGLKELKREVRDKTPFVKLAEWARQDQNGRTEAELDEELKEWEVMFNSQAKGVSYGPKVVYSGYPQKFANKKAGSRVDTLTIISAPMRQAATNHVTQVLRVEFKRGKWLNPEREARLDQLVKSINNFR